MAFERIDKTNWHRLHKILDETDHYQSEEEMRQDLEGTSLAEKYKHLQPDVEEDEPIYI